MAEEKKEEIKEEKKQQEEKEQSKKESKGKPSSAKKKEDKNKQELEELKDKHLRLVAEFDNFKKRTVKEKIELPRMVEGQIIVDFLPVVDDFERALSHIKEPEDSSINEGLLMILNKFKDFLKSKGVSELEVKEKDFDTETSEAITNIPAPTPELKGKVIDVIQKGYIMGDKVIRFAKVVVGE